MAGPTGSTILQPIAWAVTVGTAVQLVVPSNPTRSGLVFIDGGSVVVAICPATVNVIPSGTAPATPALPNGGTAGVLFNQSGIPVINGPGSITMNPGDKFILDNLPTSMAWNGIAAAANAGFTVLEFL